MNSVSSTDPSTGALLKRAREAADLTQIEAAKILGISKWTYIALENGRGHFHYEWLDLLPAGMRNAVIEGFEKRHRATIRENEAAIRELRKLLIVPPVDAARKTISRPTASSPSL